MLDSVRLLEVNVLKRSKEQSQWTASLGRALSAQEAMIRQPIALAPAAPPHWLLSSKQLDLLLLAACSCLLTVICHPAMPLQSAANSAAVQSSLPSTASQLNFYVKSALMSSFQQEDQDVTLEE